MSGLSYPCGAATVKTLIAISAVILVLVLFFFRLHKESGMMELQRCRTAVGQAKSWTIETTVQYDQNSAPSTTRYKVSCPDDYKYQSTIHTHGVTYVETVEGKWEQSVTANNSPIPTECGKGPALVQMTVLHAITELPHRRAGKLTRGQLQTIEGVRCQEWNVDYGNEWPQTAAYTVCVNPETHLPRRMTFAYPNATHDFTGWNSTTVEPPAL